MDEDVVRNRAFTLLQGALKAIPTRHKELRKEIERFLDGQEDADFVIGVYAKCNFNEKLTVHNAIFGTADRSGPVEPAILRRYLGENPDLIPSALAIAEAMKKVLGIREALHVEQEEPVKK